MALGFRTHWAKVQAVLRRQTPVGRASPAVAAPVPFTADWDEAFLRVESYLRAHLLENRVLLNRLTAEIIEAARAVAVLHPEVPPVAVAMQVTHARIGAWMVEALGDGDWTDDRFRARARLSLLLADVPYRFPDKFLSLADLPPEVTAEMATRQLEPGPGLRRSGMPSAELEFPAVPSVGSSWVTFSRSAFARGALPWVAIVGTIGIAWFLTR